MAASDRHLDRNSLLDPDHHSYLTESRGSGDTASADESTGGAVYPTVMAYIIGWQYAWILLLFTAVVMLNYMWKYIVYVRDLYREATP